MTLLLRLCLFTFLLLLLGVLTVFALCIESSPLVAEQAQLSLANTARVKQILRQHRPGNLRSGETKTITLSEKELNLLASHLTGRLNSVGAVLKIKEGLLALKTTWDISAFLPYKKQAAGYLNIEAVVGSSAGDSVIKGLNIHSLRVGQVSFPTSLIPPLVKFTTERIAAVPALHDGGEIIRALDIRAEAVTLTYRWRADLIEKIRGRLITADERQALAVYNQFLVSEVVRQGRGLTFTRLLEATFRFARLRSKDSDPIAENKAAIIVLAAYANGGGLSTLVPEARDWPKPRRAKLRLHGRRDLVQHFMTSAALAVVSGSATANSIGLYKEIEDAKVGSGFSFKDLAADLAGARFAEVALTSRHTARQLQEALVTGQGNSLLLPSLQGLPENLKQAHFRRDYGEISDLRYRRVVLDIETRINALALYRQPQT